MELIAIFLGSLAVLAEFFGNSLDQKLADQA